MKKVVIKEDKKIEKKEEKKEEKKVVLEEVIAKKEDFVLRKQGNFFVSKKPGKYEVHFASREEDYLLELRKENHPLKMNFFGRTGRMKKAKSIQGKMKENQMTYEEIEEGMDLQYVCQEKGIKESLIIKNRKDHYDYDFEMEIGDLAPVYNEKENVLELTSNGKKIYRILSPYMEDQNHERSEACSYQIVEKGEHTLTLHLHCDETWMNDENRAFPVIVDPTIEVVNSAILEVEEWYDGIQRLDAKTYQLGLVCKRRLVNKVLKISKTYHSFHFFIHSQEIKETYAILPKIYLSLSTKEINENLDEGTEFVLRTQASELKRLHKSDFHKQLFVNLSDLISNSNEEVIELFLYDILDPNYIEFNLEMSMDDARGVGDYIVTFHGFPSENENLSPKLIFVSKEEDFEEAPAKEYSTGKRDVTDINLVDGSWRHFHSHPISIQQNSLMISLQHIYDNKEKNEVSFGVGWRSNLHQYLKKSPDFNRMLGSKEIQYIDGEGKSHWLQERWYYFDKNKKKVFVEKKDIFLDSDQKLKYKVGDTQLYEVKYDVKSKDGWNYVSGNSATNYNQRSVSQKYHYEIEFGDGERLREIEVVEKGKIRVPRYVEILENEEIGIAFEEIDSTSMVSLITGNKVERRGVLERSFGIDDGGVFIEYPIEDITYAKTYLKIVSDLLEYEDLDGVYVNEDIMNINESLRNNVNYLDDVLNNLLQVSSSLEGLLKQEKLQNISRNYANEMKKIQAIITKENQSLFDYRERAHKIIIDDLLRTKVIDLQDTGGRVFDPDNYSLYDINTATIDKIKEESKIENYLNAFNFAVQKLSMDIERTIQFYQDIYQTKTEEKELEEEKLSKESITLQLKMYNEQLSQALDKYSKQVIVIRSLQEQKQALIEEQKKQVNDFIVDKEGNALGFDGYGRLVLIQDKYENKIQIEFGYEKENEGKMLSIYSDNQTIKLNYDKETKQLSSILDSHGKEIKFEYDGFHLKRICHLEDDYTLFDNKKNFKVTSVNLESLEIILNVNQTLTVSTLGMKTVADDEGYLDLIDEKTKLTGKEKTEIRTNELFIFDANHAFTLVRNKIENNSDELSETIDDEKYQFDSLGKVIEEKNKKTITRYIYEGKNIECKATYLNDSTKAVIKHIPIQDTSKSYHVVFESPLNYSNFLGVRISLKSSLSEKDAPNFKLRITNSTGTNESTYVYFNRELENKVMIFPVFVEAHKLESIDFEVLDDTNFGTTSIASMDLIKLEDVQFFSYDNEGRLVKEQDGCTTITYQEFNDKDIPLTKIETNIYGEKVTTQYHYNANDQLTCVEDSKQNVVEYEYDEKGNCIEKRSYNRKDASLMRVEKTSFDEQGRPSSKEGTIKDSNGCYPKEEVTYLPGTSLVRKIKGMNGETVCYQYDRNSEDLLSISSSSKGINNSTVFSYNYGLLTSMSHHGVKVNYVYDGRGRKVKVLLNGEEVMWNQYDDDYQGEIADPFQENMVISVDGSYMNSSNSIGLYVSNYQDVDGKDVLQTYSGDDSSGATKYIYDSEDRVKTIQSKIKYRVSEEYKETLTNDYDVYGNVICQEKKVNDVSSVKVEHQYDETNRYIQSTDLTLEGKHQSKTDYQREDGVVTNVAIQKEVVGEDATVSLLPILNETFEYDVLGRVKHQNLHANQVDLCHEYSYLQQDENTLDFIAEDITKVKIQNGDTTTYLIETTQYEYDVNGNIVSIDQDDKKTRYFYDSCNRLIREDNPDFKKTYVYQYDKAGNLLLKKTYSYNMISPELQAKPIVTEYVYDCENRDRLISFQGKECCYDKMGRPTTYKGDKFVWNYQGQLIGIKDNIKYFYDTNGIRRKKMVGEEVTTFITNGSQILSMKKGNHEFVFRYVLNQLVGFYYNDGTSGKEYLYQRNILGDIVGILNDSGEQVGEYAYDAYGNQKVVLDVNGIASLNPFRYRGYFWDDETKFYYLNARYYDPETGRFISPDTLSILDETRGQINGLNLYMYCGDNPVMNVDPSGCVWWNPFTWNWEKILNVAGAVLIVAGLAVGAALTAGSVLGVVLAGAAIGGAISGVSQFVSTGSINYGQFILDIGVGALSAFIGTTGIGFWGSAFVGGFIGGGSSILSDVIAGREIDWLKAGISFGIGFVSGMISGAGAKNQNGLKKFARDMNPKIKQYDKTVNKMAEGLAKRAMEARIKKSVVKYTSAYAMDAITKAINVYMFSSGFGIIFNQFYENKIRSLIN